MIFASVCAVLLAGAAAAAPSGPTPQGPEERVTPTRGEIVLNGVWRFAPAVGAEAPPASQMGLIWTPGDWRREAGDAPTLVAEGQGEAWKADRNELAKAWYEREIIVPSAWAGRRVLLDMRRVSTDAEVFLDGQKAGKVEWPEGEVDLTALVRPGAAQTLRVLVAAAADEGEVAVLMGVGQVSTSKASLNWRGIMDDVLLVSRPMDAWLSDVFVQTSTRKQTIRLDIEVSGASPGGTGSVTAEMLDESGQVEKTFRSAAALPKGRGRAAVEWKWTDPRLWDLDKPSLYTLRLTVEGPGFKDTALQRFGFREFWIEGRSFMLNGIPFRFRPALGYDGGVMARSEETIRSMRSRGFNIQEIWPNNDQVRGYAQWWQHHVEVADRFGFPLMGPSVHMDPVVSWWQPERWSSPAARAKWLAAFERSIRRLRNSPSILLWANSGNNFGHNDDQAPTRIGQSRRNPVWSQENERWTTHHNNGDKVFAAVRQFDPTRPFMAHQGGPISDIYTANTYLNLLPLQDREEWLSHWAKSGDMPFVAVEFGTPLNCTVLRGRNGFGGAIASEPFATEYSAMLFGSAAYQMEEDRYRKAISDNFIEGQAYRWWIFEPTHQFGPPFQAIQDLYIRNTWRSWRTWGISGGMIPWAGAHGFEASPSHPAKDLAPFVPGQRGLYNAQVAGRTLAASQTVHPAGRALIQGNQPTLAWIGGKASHWTEKKHSFWEGDKVAKSVILINDERAPQAYSASWKSGTQQGTFKGTLPPGQTVILPFEFRTAAAGRSRIELEAEIGQSRHKDSFSYRVFQRRPARRGAVSLWDPAGETRAALARAGYRPVPAASNPSGLVVVGRRGLSYGRKLPFDAESFVRRGGRLLIMAQDPAWLENEAGFRVSRYASRRAFPIPNERRISAGLTAADLADWAGAGTLLPAKPDPKTLPRHTSDTTPSYGWPWGMQGTVASVMVEKPHRAGWTPLLEGEFDLAYSPLLALRWGLGLVMLCTLDLEDQASQDPVASLLLDRVLAEARSRPLPAPASQTLYLGGDASLFEGVGLVFQRAARLPESAAGVLAVAAADAQISQKDAEAFMAKGGRLVFLPRTTTLGPAVFSKEGSFVGSLSVPNWTEAAGLSASDLRRRSHSTAWLAAGPNTGAGGQLARWQFGKGTAVFFQMDPDMLDADSRTYLRLTRWRQTRALAQVLANMGASFQMDRRIFLPGRQPEGELALAGQWHIRMTLDPATVSSAEGPDPGPSPAALALANAAKGAGGQSEGWTPVKMPAMWDPMMAKATEAVLQKTVDLPASWAGKELVLALGGVDDYDVAWFNGVKVGSTDSRTPMWWSHRREYTVPAGLARAGRNTITVRVLNTRGGGGMSGPAHAMAVKLKGFRAPGGFYHPDYRTDWELGDDPYRYYRW